VKLSVVLVAPLRLLNVTPAFVLTCHCTVGVVLPLAVEMKLAVAPAFTVTFTGSSVTVGAVCARAEALIRTKATRARKDFMEYV